MDNQKIAAFFDECAGSWDEHMVIDEEIIERILDNTGVSEGKDILDAACGTGVLFPFYRKRNVASLTGIDLSEKMCEIARGKGESVLQGDAGSYPFEEKFDCILLYNAFPHIADKEGFLRHMSGLLKEDGIFSIAHGMSYEMLERHHQGVPEDVASPLPPKEELKKMMEKYFDITACVFDERMMQIAGRKR